MLDDRYFVDTNVLLYCISAEEPQKQRAALQWMDRLWQARTGRISWQVIHEFHANATRKTGGLEAREFAEQMTLWNPSGPSGTSLERAWHWIEAAKINFWDALILAAAEETGSRYLLSEDFQAGRQFGSVTVVSPFG